MNMCGRALACRTQGFVDHQTASAALCAALAAAVGGAWPGESASLASARLPYGCSSTGRHVESIGQRLLAGWDAEPLVAPNRSVLYTRVEALMAPQGCRPSQALPFTSRALVRVRRAGNPPIQLVSHTPLDSPT